MYKEDIAKIGKLVAMVRKEKGYSKYAVMKENEVKMDVTQITRIEENTHDYQISKLIGILKVLNIKIVLSTDDHAIVL